MLKVLLKESELIVKNADGPWVVASVDVFRRICELRDHCAALPLAPLLLACVRCDPCIRRCVGDARGPETRATDLRLSCAGTRSATQPASRMRSRASFCRRVHCSRRRPISRRCDPTLSCSGCCWTGLTSILWQATAAQRATSALQALHHACGAPGSARPMQAPVLNEARSEVEPMDEELDLEPDEYDASSDDADDAAYCMQPAV